MRLLFLTLLIVAVVVSAEIVRVRRQGFLESLSGGIWGSLSKQGNVGINVLGTPLIGVGAGYSETAGVETGQTTVHGRVRRNIDSDRPTKLKKQACKPSGTQKICLPPEQPEA